MTSTSEQFPGIMNKNLNKTFNLCGQAFDASIYKHREKHKLCSYNIQYNYLILGLGFEFDV